MITILDDENCSVWVYPDDGIVHNKVKKFVYGEKFREMLNKGSEAFKKYNCTKWLSDDREGSALRMEDREWATSNWERPNLEAGWKYWAIVLPEKTIGKMNMNHIIKRHEKLGVSVKVVTDPDEGLKWLKDQK